MTNDFPYGTKDGRFPLPFGERDDRPGLLVLTDMGGTGEIAAAAEAAGLRLLEVVGLEDASSRLDIQLGCDVILLLCDRPSPILERLLVQVETFAIQREIPVILVAGLDTIDLAYACTRNDRTQLLCQPDETDLAATLLAAAESVETVRSVHDLSSDSDGIRLQKLSDEVSRLARTLETLTQRQQAAPSFELGPRISDRPSDYIGMPALSPLGEEQEGGEIGKDVTPQQVRDLLRARRLRDEFLPGDLFADPAWDMLLDLFAARLEQERVSVSSLCIASAVPPTTALRWIRTLTERGLLQRQADPLDGRRIFIALADSAAIALTRWFRASRRFVDSEGRGGLRA
ncbi:winged helix DNA-binding protein [Sphingobium cloacae]|uniref:MarR-family transcriptional regulator n=1 Tax=Sphingobium cloacae TaxID=120107 RepID=A0A1E1F3N7_9SPHN|nr:winged helix DNA-binding protein [Sphingobium cloacae]BAV65051.1 MarR-family transcriptional regulator [Sphingobium cloacae]